MKKAIIIFLSLLFVACSIKTKKEQFSYLSPPVKFIQNQKYGLFNPNTKEVIVYPHYTYIENFSNGYGLGILGEEGNFCEILDYSGNILFSYETEPLSRTYCFNGFFSFIYDKNDNYYHGLYDYKGNQVLKSDFIYGMNNECLITKKNSNYIFIFFDMQGLKKRKLYYQIHIHMNLL